MNCIRLTDLCKFCFLGLFHKAIAQSGSALNIWAHGSQCAKTIAEVLGFQSGNEKEILQLLQEIPVEKILWAQDNIRDVKV